MTGQQKRYNSVVLDFWNLIFIGCLLMNDEQNFVRIAACISDVERAIISIWQVGIVQL
jgi:hypothetical protein